MKSRISFMGKKEKKCINNLSSTDVAQRVLISLIVLIVRDVSFFPKSFLLDQFC